MAFIPPRSEEHTSELQSLRQISYAVFCLKKFDVKPRMKDIYWAFWHPLKLTIHEPIEPIGKGADNIKNQMNKSYEAIMNGLDKKYQGFVENPDQ